MSDNFQQTVDLKEKLNSQNRKRFPTESQFKKSISKKNMVNAEEVDKMYETENVDNNNLHKIDRVHQSSFKFERYFKVIFVLILAICLGFVYYKYFFQKAEPITSEEYKNSLWYSVKLINDETYYGQIESIKENPVVIKNVYYDYDQINQTAEKEEKKESSNLRLVKRGKETHGPDGTMSVYQVQIKLIEPLKNDSKVLQAILENEK